MRVKSCFMFAIAAARSSWFFLSVPTSISALRSVPSSTCRTRSSRFGLMFGGGPAPAGFCANVAPATRIEKNPAVRKYDRFFIRSSSRRFNLILRALIDANIIDQHLLRENGSSIRVPRPAATDCYVQNKKERMIENPFCVGGKIRRCARLVENSIDIETQHVGLPLNGEVMEIIRKLPALGQCVSGAYALPC